MIIKIIESCISNEIKINMFEESKINRNFQKFVVSYICPLSKLSLACPSG